ncbi:enoyl-CoA hydratase/isomerase family protein [Solimonas sp. K1W22B-7]|uniref:enoyl-CoA hydratase/isomerase family protein n=1 Tax=Solimonas sp. K1W22B-7 TaxID=2303331 RepID=UPI0013C4CF2F|nr:enoyl-CoA hydratase-related protein [Solimonas sp. K1W22B-7]
MTTNEYVSVERNGGVTTLTLRAIGRMPVLSLASGNALADAAEALKDDAETRVVVLRGDNGQFCAGGDIAAIRDALPDPDRLLGPIIDGLHRTVRNLRALPQPVVASVAGAAAGGGMSLAVACDLIVAASDARFVVGYGALGTSSDGGLSYTLTRRIGANRAMDVILARGMLDAATAHAWGLVAKLAEPAALEPETAAYAAQLAKQTPQVLREFKQLIGSSAEPDLSARLDAERAAFLRCAKTEDFARRVNAFLEKKR